MFCWYKYSCFCSSAHLLVARTALLWKCQFNAAVSLGVSTGTPVLDCTVKIPTPGFLVDCDLEPTPPPLPNHNCHHLHGAAPCDRQWLAVSPSLPPCWDCSHPCHSHTPTHTLTRVLFSALFFHCPVPAGCHMLTLERIYNLLHDSLCSHMGTAKWAVVPFICLGK